MRIKQFQKKKKKKNTISDRAFTRFYLFTPPFIRHSPRVKRDQCPNQAAAMAAEAPGVAALPATAITQAAEVTPLVLGVGELGRAGPQQTLAVPPRPPLPPPLSLVTLGFGRRRRRLFHVRTSMSRISTPMLTSAFTKK